MKKEEEEEDKKKGNGRVFFKEKRKIGIRSIFSNS